MGAGLLWTACCRVMTPYPTENQKGRYSSMFFFESFAGVASEEIIPVAQNRLLRIFQPASRNCQGWHICCHYRAYGCDHLLALVLVEPSKVVRNEETLVKVAQHRPLLTALANIFYSVKKESWIVFFLPFSFAGLFCFILPNRPTISTVIFSMSEHEMSMVSCTVLK